MPYVIHKNRNQTQTHNKPVLLFKILKKIIHILDRDKNLTTNLHHQNKMIT